MPKYTSVRLRKRKVLKGKIIFNFYGRGENEMVISGELPYRDTINRLLNFGYKIKRNKKHKKYYYLIIKEIIGRVKKVSKKKIKKNMTWCGTKYGLV